MAQINPSKKALNGASNHPKHVRPNQLPIIAF
jgi:hypothetical protein